MSETDGSVESGADSGASSGWITDDADDMEDADDTDSGAGGMASAVGGAVLWRFLLQMPCA